MANRWNPQQIAPFIPHQPKRYGVGIPVGQAKFWGQYPATLQQPRPQVATI